MISLLKKAPKGRRLLVTGCLPLINLNRLTSEVEFQGALGPAPGEAVIEAVKRILTGEKVLSLENNAKPPLSLPRITSSPVRRIIPVAYGCIGQCNYCAVRLARGRLRSYTVEEVIEQVKEASAHGAQEIWLTAQDLACYGQDKGEDLVSLLERIAELEGEFFVRLGMMNPAHLREILPDLAHILRDRRFFKFVHLPLQSGDDEVLHLMNRGYTAADFRDQVSLLRREMPNLTLATDLICGFPGESDEAFDRSLKLLEEVRPDIVNVSKFKPRPNTPAEGMEQLPNQTIKARSIRASTLARQLSLERNQLWIGWSGEVLVDEPGKYGTWMGRNFAYKPIILQTGGDHRGKRLQVKVVRAGHNHLKGEIV